MTGIDPTSTIFAPARLDSDKESEEQELTRRQDQPKTPRPNNPTTIFAAGDCLVVRGMHTSMADLCRMSLNYSKARTNTSYPRLRKSRAWILSRCLEQRDMAFAYTSMSTPHSGQTPLTLPVKSYPHPLQPLFERRSEDQSQSVATEIATKSGKIGIWYSVVGDLLAPGPHAKHVWSIAGFQAILPCGFQSNAHFPRDGVAPRDGMAALFQGTISPVRKSMPHDPEE